MNRSFVVLGACAALLMAGGTVPAFATDTQTQLSPASATSNDEVRHTLDEGEELTHDDPTIWSTNMQYSLTFADGQLTFNNGKQLLWSSTTVFGGSHAEMLADGNFAIPGADGAMWSSGTASAKTWAGPLQLTITNDGKLQMRGTHASEVVWQRTANDSKLEPGDELLKGRELRSPSGTSKLVYDGERIAVVKSDGTTAWETPRVPESRGASLTPNGDLVLLGADRKPAWFSRTSGDVAATVTDAGAIQIRSHFCNHLVWENGSRLSLESGTGLDLGKDTVKSPNGAYSLTVVTPQTFRYQMQVRHSDGRVMWQTDRAIPFAIVASMTKDNLVFGAQTSQPWSSQTADLASADTGPLRAVVSNDGKLQIKGSKNDRVVWENGKFLR